MKEEYWYIVYRRFNRAEDEAAFVYDASPAVWLISKIEDVKAGRLQGLPVVSNQFQITKEEYERLEEILQ